MNLRVGYFQELSRFTRITNIPMKTILFLIVSEIFNDGAEYENNHLDAAGKRTYHSWTGTDSSEISNWADF